MNTYAINYDDLENRIDPSAYHPTRISAVKKIKALPYKGLPLKQVVTFKRDIVTEADEDTPYIGLENIESNTGIASDIEKGKQFGSAFKFKKGDILFPKLRPYLNKVHLATNEGVCSTEFHILEASKCNAYYLFAFLNSDLVVNQTSYLMTGNTLPRLQTQDVESLLIPLLPEAKQSRITNLLKGAYKSREEKLKQADELLNSIDGYMRQQLGIDYTEPEEEKLYTVNSQDLEDNRQDPYYYNPKFVNLLNAVSSNLKTLALSDVSENVFNGNTPAKENYTDEGKPIVKVSCLKKNKIEWSNLAYAKDKKLNKHLKNNDILLLSSAHQAEYLGKNPCIVEIPDDLQGTDITFVGELICIRPNIKLINPYYLLAILRLDEYHQLINREKRGQTSHIYPNDLEKIKIPLANKAKQDAIAQEFKDRLSKAENLKNEAFELLEEAKKKVEEMILN